nr:hypothetical protein [uncultured Roseateles sp.]
MSENTSSTEDDDPQADEYVIGNYCVSFVDLLGQRDALRGQGLLVEPTSAEERERLHATLRASIGSIAKLQKRAEDLLASSKPKIDSARRAELTPAEQEQWDAMLRSNVTTQRWSDGLMSFACLGDTAVKCHLNNVFALFGLAGSLCFMGLAAKQPIRGALEIAWGIELHKGELYGAAVARAYELESEGASYPRIVVGPELIRYLELHAQRPDTDAFAAYERTLAAMCRSMLLEDVDGRWFIDYLGDTFRRAITNAVHADLYERARAFVLTQVDQHRNSQNAKLAFRYVHLLKYFDSFPPAGSNESSTS